MNLRSKHLTGARSDNVNICTKFNHKPIVAAVSLAIALSAGHANAVLERAGPVSNATNIGGFPTWYQDTTGLAVEFCSPTNQAEVDGGWCLLVPGDPPSIPEVFPASFFDEHFYFAAGAALTPSSGGKASLTLAIESAFATAVQAGDQMTFSRIRVLLNPVPVTGTYRFIHPYGEEVIDGVAGERIFFTDDVGIGSPGDFSGALHSRVGPILLPSNTPGGAELPAIQGPAGKYIADPARIGAVTGSPVGQNVFRIEGPPGSALGVGLNGLPVDFIETTDFSLMGRVFTGVMPSRVNVERANYTNDLAGKKIDVYATAEPTTHGRLPTEVRPVPVAPQLTFFDTACMGVIDPDTHEVLPPFTAPTVGNEIQMQSATPNIRWGQAQPGSIPASICVKDSSSRDVNGAIVPTYYSEKVRDEIAISQASFDPIAGTLKVKASSSDSVAPPVLSLAFGTFLEPLTAGEITVSGLSAAPSEITVLSDAGGNNKEVVSSSFGVPGSVGPVNLPVAVNDSFTIVEDSPAMTLNVLANDSQVNGGKAVLTSLPRLGTATVDLNGNVVYTPNVNASGADQFTYAIADVTTFSNPGAVTVNITPTNDAPTAVNDSANAIAGIPVQINVLANDIDPDGAADLVGITNLTQPIGTTVTKVGGVVTFNAAVGAFYTFTYQAVDSAGEISANTASVTVQVAAGETLAIARNEYVRSKGTLRTEGTVTPATGQTVKLEFFNNGVGGGVIGLPFATVSTDVTGAWAYKQSIVLPAGANAVRATSSKGGVSILTLSIK